MIHRIVKFVQCVVAVFAVMLAFGFMSASDEIILQGADLNISVSSPMVPTAGPGQNIDTRAAADFIKKTAMKQQGNIARIVPDLQNPTSHRNLYLAVGDRSDRSATWIQNGYPDFTRSMTTTVQPFDDIAAMDVRGQYVLFGPPSLESELTAGLQNLGFEVSSVSVSPWETFKWFLSTSGLGSSLLILALIVVVSSGAGVILNARSYSIQRLQGSSFGTVLGRDIRAMGRFSGPVYGGVALLTTIALFFYNSWHQIAQFCIVTGVLAAALLLAAALTHIGVLALVWRVPLIAAVKGHIPSKSTLAATYAVRIVASFLALGIASATLALGGQVLSQQESKAVWAANSDLSLLQFAGNQSPQKFREYGDLFGAAARDADRDGKAVFAYMRPFESFQNVDPNGTVPALSGPPVVYVNSTYLQRETVLDAQGQRIMPSGTVRLLVPKALNADLAKISGTITRSFVSEQPLAETVLIADNQTINAFGSYNGIQADTAFPNAVLLAGPAGGDWMNTIDYMAYATSGGMLFTNPEDMITRTDQAGAQGFVTGFHPAALDASTIFQKDASALRNHFFSTVAALAVLIVTSLGVAIIYTRKNSQKIFVSYIHGWQSWRVNARLLAVEAAAAIVLVGYGISIAVKEAAAAAERATGAASPIPMDAPPLVEWAPAIAAVIALLSITFTLLALRGYKTSLIHSHSADA